MARVPLPIPANANPDTAQDWRADRAGPDTVGHMIALGNDRFLTTDGSSGLSCWEWKPKANLPDLLPPAKAGIAPTLELTDPSGGSPPRIVSAPLLLPGKPGDPPRVCVADAAGRLSLIEVLPNGDLVVKKTWDVGGTVTTGPFLADRQNLRIAAVVDKSRLVWIDPARNVVLWNYRTADDDAIVGTPRLVDGMVVVADQSGLYIGLDPQMGDKAGPGYRLRGSVAPVATPVAFSKGRLLAPLSDGTVMLLSARRLLKK
jgi:outer membrane protein assembly factor BamB